MSRSDVYSRSCDARVAVIKGRVQYISSYWTNDLWAAIRTCNIAVQWVTSPYDYIPYATDLAQSTAVCTYMMMNLHCLYFAPDHRASVCTVLWSNPIVARAFACLCSCTASFMRRSASRRHKLLQVYRPWSRCSVIKVQREGCSAGSS